MKRRLIFAAAATLSTLVLFIVAATMGMAFALQNDVDALAKQTREAKRAEKSLREEIAAVKDELAALDETPAKSASAATPAPASAPAVAAPVAVAAVPVRPAAARARAAAAAPAPAAASQVAVVSPGLASVVKVGAAVTPECAFHSGDSAGLMDCIRQQQDRLGKIPPTPYR